MTASVTIGKASNIVTLRLTASELVEPKLLCTLDCTPELQTALGERYSSEVVRVLCGAGLVHARRRMEISHGLQISITDVRGTLDRSDEIGLSHATSLAIARSLKKDYAALFDSLSSWKLLS